MLAHAAATLALLHAGGAIKAYDGWTAWQDVDAHGHQYVIKVRSPSGHVTARPERAGVDDPIDPEPQGLPFDLGPDARGRPSIVVGACAGTCHLRIGRLPSRPSRPIGGTEQKDMPSTVTFWRQTLAWSDLRRQLHLRRRAGAPERVLHPFAQPHATVEEAELHGDLLAATIRYEDQSAPDGSAVGLAVADVATGHRETLATVQPGEGGQQLTGPSFTGGHTLSWLLTCFDSGSCTPRFGIYRRDLRARATVFSEDRHPHVGFAAVSGTTMLIGPDQTDCVNDPGNVLRDCRIEERHAAFG
jgi:hypothetical protein